MPNTKKPRLKNYYDKEVVPLMMKKFSLKNKMQVPSLEKILVNMGIGEAVQNSKTLEYGVSALEDITGQKPVVAKAKKSIAAFKLRQGVPIGCYVTLRKQTMWEFLDRLVNIALPRVKDFRGTPVKFDGNGNYTLGVKEQIIFPEVDYDKVDKIRGLNITIVTNSGSDEMSQETLRELGVPFRRKA